MLGGSNPTLNSTIAKSGQIGDFSSGLGEKNTTQGSNFFSSLLSGDSTKTAQVLAPQISSLKTSVNQDQKTAAQNGTRSGGTAAGNAAEKDKVHADITNLTGNLTGAAASSLLNSGTSLLSAATGEYGQQADLSQKQAENWANSLFGKGITSGIAAGESAGLGAIGI